LSKSFIATPMSDLRGYLTEAEVKKLYDAAESLRDKLLVRLFFVTGARVSEVVGDVSWKNKRKVFHGLRVKDVDWKNGVLYLDTLKRKHYPPPKRIVPIDSITLGLLRQFCELNVLENEDKVFNLTRQRATQIIKELGAKAGIEKVGQKKLHVHHLRHSHCIAYVKRNNSLEGLRKLQRKLGHANIETTAHYLQYAPEERREVEEIFANW